MTGAANRIVLGLGGCVDFEVDWDAAVLQRLVDAYAITASEVDRSAAVESERDLVRSVVAFLRDGGGGERFVASADVVTTFAARFRGRATLGGTGVRAAIAMSRLGLASTVHLVSIDDTVRRLLPAQVSYVCSADHDSTDPHLILQFPAGAGVRVGDQMYRAAQANRLIYVNDHPNQQMRLSPELGPLLEQARIFLISGLNTMRDARTLAERLTELRTLAHRLPPEALVIFEDAGYHLPAMSDQVRTALLDQIDVYGMNEDEFQAHLGRTVDLLDAAHLATALAAVRERIPARTLVVHTQHWALAHGELAPRYRQALETATATAATRYAHGDDFTDEDYRDILRQPRSDHGAALATALDAHLPESACCVPAFSLSVPCPTTIGLGDAFVGGFVAGLARSSGQFRPRRPTR
jgi:ADP-dependent phosphofructokinase/glucokinase